MGTGDRAWNGSPNGGGAGYKYTRLLAAPGATAAGGGGDDRFAGPLAIVAGLSLAAGLVISLTTSVWTVQGTSTGLLNDWDGQVQGTMTRPEPGTKQLVWAASAAAWASDVALCLAGLPIPRVIARFANRQTAAALAWIGVVLMSAAGDAIRRSPGRFERPRGGEPVPARSPLTAHRPPARRPQSTMSPRTWTALRAR